LCYVLGSHACAELLLSRGAEIQERSSDNPATPLHESARKGDLAMCELLLKYKVSQI
jgi:ankyrin repeat protein